MRSEVEVQGSQAWLQVAGDPRLCLRWRQCCWALLPLPARLPGIKMPPRQPRSHWPGRWRPRSTTAPPAAAHPTAPAQWASLCGTSSRGGLCQTGAPAIPVVELGIAQAHAAMLAGSLNCSALVAAYLQRIAAFDQRTQLNSIRALHPHAVEVSCPTKPPWQHCQPAAILCCSFGCPAPAPAPPSLTCCEPLRSPACWHAACR